MFRLGIADFVSEHPVLDLVLALGIQDARPVLDVFERGLVRGERHQLVRPRQRDEDGGAPAGVERNTVAFGLEHLRQGLRHFLHFQKARFDDESVLPLHQGLVEHLDHLQRQRDQVQVAPQQQRIAVPVGVDLQLLPVEHVLQRPRHGAGVDDLQGHELKNRPVRGGHFRQGSAADEQGNIPGRDFRRLDEAEHAVLVSNVDAVILQDQPRGREKLAGRDRFAEA